jgi:(p)ppGpp synthase/HD superfamily hydrolase
MEIQKLYQEAIKFASAKHAEKGQKVPGTNLPYDVHISNVAMEVLIAGFNTPGFDTEFVVQVALLQDTIEDTATDFHELENKSGIKVANAVSALSKNKTLPKDRQMQDCPHRIKGMPPEVWAVKLADRITSLQPPPSQWDNAKKMKYHKDAQIILDALGSENDCLASLLAFKINEYRNYFSF